MQWIRPGDLCFDIGAHVGNRSAALLAIGARVIAVEPQPLFARTLRRIFRSSHLTMVESAVGASSGRQEMLVSTRNPTVSTTSPDWAAEVARSPGFTDTNWDKRIEVEVTSLDALIVQFGLPAFCKIDVEGAEPEVLRGLSSPIPLLSFEVLPAVMDRARTCLERLGALGNYEFNLVDGEFPRLAFSEWVERSRLETYLRTLSPTQRAGEVYAHLAG